MTSALATPPARWRVAVTRDEPSDGPLSSALRAQGFVPIRCALVEERPPHSLQPLVSAVAVLPTFDWVIVSSGRALRAMVRCGLTSWPRGLRSAAVGTRTAADLRALGADPPPIIGDVAGADALWTRLEHGDRWAHRRVLVPAVDGGRRTLVDALRAQGALVTEVEAYVMAPVEADRIRVTWHDARPHAVVIASPSAATILLDAIGRDALHALTAIVAIGPTTAAALQHTALPVVVSSASTFDDAARLLALVRSRCAHP